MTKFIVTILVAAAAANAQTGDAAKGKELYTRYTCYGCHGFSGQNGPGNHLVPMRMPQVAFTAYVRKPRQMPAYSAKVLSDEQLGDIWAYVKTLKDAPAAKDIPLLNEIENGK
jgi:mono/diheme cytochrome c family protein